MKSNKKTILFVSTRPPFPLLSGEKNKTYNEIRTLSKKFKIIYCSLCPSKDLEEVQKLLSPYCDEIHLFKINIFQSLFGCFKSLVTGAPLQIGYFSSNKLKNFCQKKSKLVDGIFVNLFRAVQFIEKTNTNNIYLDMSDSISEHYKNAIHATSSKFWKMIYKLESKRMREYENKFLPLFKKVFLFNPEEIKLYKNNNLSWIPHGVNKKIIDYKYPGLLKKNNKISFLGKMDYRPNIDAVKWFASQVLPHIDEKFSFQIIGAYPSSEVLKLSENPRVSVTGFVDDPYKLLKESHCVVAPMVSGGGIQNKLLESMAIGCVNVVSSICAKPLMNISKEIIVSDDPLEMAGIINGLYPDSEMYRELEQSARDYILKNYTWEKFEDVLFNEINL